MERPRLGEDEDELLKFQQEFLASKAAPSVSVVRKGDKRKSGETTRDVVHMDTLPSAAPSVDPQPPKKSRFRASRDRQPTGPSDQSAPPASASSGSPDVDPEEMIDRQDRGMAAVLSSIIERDTRHATFTMPHKSSQPFPSVVKNTSLVKSAGQRKSLFAQQIERQGVQDFGVMVQQEVSKMDISPAGSSEGSFPGQQPPDSMHQAPTKSHIVDGHGLSASKADEEAFRIHEENLTKMSEMPEEEILAEQRQLLKVLDPSIVAFLKSKSKASASADPPENKPQKKRPKQARQKKTEEPSGLPEDVPMKGKGQWVHMDKIEYDKLEWLKDLPLPSADDTKTGQQARFDFQGSVVPADAVMSVHSGLYHHGDEPERAGYSVGELFQLARSTNVQQRVLALATLGNIIQKAKEGALDDMIQTPILPSILDGGVIFLLRWACDDSVDAVVAAAVTAMCSLLCNPADEAALDVVSPWFQGSVTTALVPPATVQLMEQNKREEDDDNKAEETDADVAKRDLLQALVSRMFLLERVFYILDTRQPQAPVVVSVLHILTRVARHSTQLAYEVARNTQLMSLIFSQFLPVAWKPKEAEKGVSTVFGRPLAGAVRLVGALCQAGRHIASSLLSAYPLQKVLLRYMGACPDELKLSTAEAENLQKESFFTWRILLSYSLAADIYLDMYESIMSQVQDVASRMSDLTHQPPTTSDVCLVSALETVVPVAAIPPIRPNFNQSESVVTQTVVTCSANWSCVEGVFPMVKLCAERCLIYLAENYTQQKPSLQCSAACLNFLATYYSKVEGQPTVSAVDCLQQVEQFCNNILLPFLKSWGFRSILANLSASSSLLSTSESKRREVSKCLPELGCDAQESRVPVVSSSSPVGFLLALTRLVYVLCKVHKGVVQQTAGVIMSHEDLIGYLRKVTSCRQNHLHINHFTSFENLLHYFLVKLTVLVSPAQHVPMMHQLTLDLMSRLQEGDEFMAHDLMSTVLFNADFIPEGREEELAAASLAEMNISDTHFLRSATQEEITTNNCHLLREGWKSLAVIRNHYFKAFAHMEGKVMESRCCCLQVAQDVSTLQMRRCDSYLMPQDWVFLPLVELYNLSATVSAVQSSSARSSVSMVTSVLRWIFLLEKWRTRSLALVSVTLKVSRIMCVFLAGNHLFLEHSVYLYLASLFRCYTTPGLLNKMDFDEQVPGISSFYDLYMLFLDQYEAVSFGDPVFGAFVLLPMQQCQSCMLRQAVWQERSHLLRTLTLPVKEMLIDLDRYLSPDETDPRLMQLYAGSLLSGAVHQCWSPVLFLVALHHLNRFLFYTGDETNHAVRERLWSMVLRCKDETLKEMIIYFKQVNVQVQSAMDLYQPLPVNRATVLKQFKHKLGLE